MTTMRLLSHPFRHHPGGAVVTVEDDTDDAYAEAVAVTAATVAGERPLSPDVGIPDPAFGLDFDAAELNASLAVSGIPVTVTSVDVVTRDDGLHVYTITYDTEGD